MFARLFGKKSPKAGKGQLLVRVASKRKVAETVWELILKHPEGGDLPSWGAGAHIDIVLEKNLVRQYSLAGNPADRSCYQLAVLLEPESRGGSTRICHEVSEGDELVISEPRNHFALSMEADFYLLIAGGIGVTPLLAMAHQLHAVGKSFRFCYRSRSASWAAFAKELADQPWSDKVEYYFSDEGGRESFKFKEILANAPSNSQLYVCGPNSFIEMVEQDATDVLGEESVHSERFYPEEHDTSGDKAFELVCEKSGVTVEVPADQSIVQVLEANGIDVPTSCTEGICGSCISKVIEGEVEHRDEVLTKADREKRHLFTPCCSRARGDRLVADL
jgi:vanillate O-demethylase ferredoxin subunit